MDGVHLQYHCQYVTECKSIFFGKLIGHILYIFINYKQLRCGVAEKMSLYTVYKYRIAHRLGQHFEMKFL